MELPEISSEQNNIIQQIDLNNNVIIDSVAGSGKTTCNLHIAKHFDFMNILLITYNSKLKLETREKAESLGLFNIEIHTYHSFCLKFYDNQCFTNEIIYKIIKNKNKPLKQFNYDLIVLDEAQDISCLYYEIICKIYKDNDNVNTKISIFGDKNQSIFDFNKADKRFIEYAPELFNFNQYNWVNCKLSTSFRITYEMSLFINKCLLKEERLISNKITNNKPRYIICDCFGDKPYLTLRTFDEIKYYLNLGYKPSDIFILAPSIKSVNTPVRVLENKIKRELPDVMVYVPVDDQEKLDEEILEGKIIFSTFHQTKGLERKVVIIFGFDNSYFKFYKKKSNPLVCPNELYVATTRGLQRLTLFHHYTNEYLHFIDKQMLEECCYYENKYLNIAKKIKNRENIDYKLKNIKISVTDLLKFLPENIIIECFNQLEIVQNYTYSTCKINIPSKFSNDKTTENVSEITGIAIPTMFELKLKNKIYIYERLLDEKFEEKIFNNNDFILNFLNKPKEKKHNINKIDIQKLTPEELLYLSNCWNTYKNGYLFKIYQITNYDWLKQKELYECVFRLNNLNISLNSTFEYNLEIENEAELLDRKLVGYIDCVDKENNIVYEFKCVNKIEKEHYLQLAIYKYMYEIEKLKNNKKIKIDFNTNEELKTINLNEMTDEFDKINDKIKISNEETKYVLFNILTNEYFVIYCDFQKLKNMIKYLIYSKYMISNTTTDEEFIKNSKNIYKLYFN